MKLRNLLIAGSAIIALSGCGKETIIREVVVTSPPATEAPVTELPKNIDKYDSYLRMVLGYSAQANSLTDDQLIRLGTAVCDEFDLGASLDRVIDIFAAYSEGSYDSELFAGIIGSAVTYLCPEYQNYVNSELS